MERKRPIGVLILGALFLLFGSYISIRLLIDENSWYYAYTIEELNIMILFIGIGVGLILVKNWARILLLICMVSLMILATIYYFLNPLDIEVTRIVVIVLLVSLPTVVYLLNPKVKEHFKKVKKQ